MINLRSWPLNLGASLKAPKGSQYEYSVMVAIAFVLGFGQKRIWHNDKTLYCFASLLHFQLTLQTTMSAFLDFGGGFFVSVVILTPLRNSSLPSQYHELLPRLTSGGADFSPHSFVRNYDLRSPPSPKLIVSGPLTRVEYSVALLATPALRQTLARSQLRMKNTIYTCARQ